VDSECPKISMQSCLHIAKNLTVEKQNHPNLHVGEGGGVQEAMPNYMVEPCSCQPSQSQKCKNQHKPCNCFISNLCCSLPKLLSFLLHMD